MKSYTIQHGTTVIIGNIINPNGLRHIDLKKSPCNKTAIALVVPHDGHGIPKTRFIKQSSTVSAPPLAIT